MNKLHRRRYINVVVSMMMAFLMLAAMGTTQVHAAQYTTGTIDPAELKAGDVVYRGVQLTVDRQIVVCKKCNMIWITTGTDYGTGDMKRSEVVATEAHKDHPDKVGYSEFNWYFNLDSSGPLLKNTPYTIVENANIKYTITYNTNGGSQIAEGNQTNLPDPLPAATKDGYDFAGWYTDADFTTIARPGQALTADTTLYAKWVEHRHTFRDEWSSNDTSHWHAATCEHTTEKKDEAAHVYGTAGAERYTCSVCKYVSETRKREAEAADKKNTESEPVKVKRTEAKDAALNSKFNVKAGKTVKVTWGKVKDADGYDVYMAYCGKDKEKVVKSVKAADSLSVEISKLKKKGINQKKNIKFHISVIRWKVVIQLATTATFGRKCWIVMLSRRLKKRGTSSVPKWPPNFVHTFCLRAVLMKVWICTKIFEVRNRTRSLY